MLCAAPVRMQICHSCRLCTLCWWCAAQEGSDAGETADAVAALSLRDSAPAEGSAPAASQVAGVTARPHHLRTISAAEVAGGSEADPGPSAPDWTTAARPLPGVRLQRRGAPLARRAWGGICCCPKIPTGAPVLLSLSSRVGCAGGEDPFRNLQLPPGRRAGHSRSTSTTQPPLDGGSGAPPRPAAPRTPPLPGVPPPPGRRSVRPGNLGSETLHLRHQAAAVFGPGILEVRRSVRSGTLLRPGAHDHSWPELARAAAEGRDPPRTSSRNAQRLPFVHRLDMGSSQAPL